MKRHELINRLKQCRIVDEDKKITIKKLDYSDNPLSPVETAYKVYYSSMGKRSKSTYFGEQLGFQG
jgi:hypothetical protein